MIKHRKSLAGVFIAAATLAALSLGTGTAQATTSSVDVLGYCKSQFSLQNVVGTTVNPSDAYSWKCTYLGVPLFYGIDMNAACRFTTHLSYAYATVGNPADAYSWRCNY